MYKNESWHCFAQSNLILNIQRPRIWIVVENINDQKLFFLNNVMAYAKKIQKTDDATKMTSLSEEGI